jgi:two-component system, LuxR family, sensor kinase FixL
MDVTATRQGQEALQATQAELAHVTRIATLGEMSASIAHEVNQPLAAIVTNAEASLRLLNRDVPDIQDACSGIGDVLKDAHRAGEVIRRIRDFSRKVNPQMMQFHVNDVVEEAVTLVRHEALRYQVAMPLDLASDVDDSRPRARAHRPHTTTSIRSGVGGGRGRRRRHRARARRSRFQRIPHDQA